MVVKCQEVPVFHPTLRDVNGSWEAYIESIERRFAHVGLAKIVPPKGWTPRKAGYSDDFDFPIPRPIRQALDPCKELTRAPARHAVCMQEAALGQDTGHVLPWLAALPTPFARSVRPFNR